MANMGKIFENNWRESVPKNVFFYRFRDSSGTWSGGDNIRFTPSNIADCLIYDSYALHLIELKTHKGKSIPFSCIVGNKTKQKQLHDLEEANKHIGVYSSIIVFFSDIERCFELGIEEFLIFYNNTNRKSIPLEYFEEHGTEIIVKKLRTNYRFDIESWLKQY